jgi:hypothetical protein
MRYMPMLEAFRVKEQTYGAGLRLVNRLIMKISALANSEFGRKFDRLNEDNKYRNEVVFPSPLPRDESIELDRAMKRLDIGLTSKRYEMQKMGFSQREIEKINDDIRDEREDQAELEFGLGQRFMEDADLPSLDLDRPSLPSGKQNSGNPNPMRPNPDVAGMGISNSSLKERLDG